MNYPLILSYLFKLDTGQPVKGFGPYQADIASQGMVYRSEAFYFRKKEHIMIMR